MLPAGPRRLCHHGLMQAPLPTAQRSLRAADVVAVAEQLGREPTTPFTVVARCTGGHPLVIRNAPIDAHGDPFPTTYWLTCPTAVKAVARVESGGAIARMNDRIHADEAFDRAVEGRPSRLRRRPRHRPRDGARLGWGGGHAHGREVPARALRLPRGGWRRSRRGMDRRTDRAGPSRAATGTRRRDRPGHELDPAPRGRTGHAADRARARHGDHAAGQGRGPHRSPGPGATGPHRGGARHVLSPCARARGRAHPRGRHERRARRREPRGVRRGRAPAQRRRPGDHHR